MPPVLLQLLLISLQSRLCNAYRLATLPCRVKKLWFYLKRRVCHLKQFFELVPQQLLFYQPRGLPQAMGCFFVYDTKPEHTALPQNLFQLRGQYHHLKPWR